MAGGTENMSRAPYLLPGARWGERLGNGTVVDPHDPRGADRRLPRHPHGRHRGEPRRALRDPRADQDAFAAESQRRAAVRDQERRVQGRDRARRRPAARRARRASTPTSIRGRARRRSPWPSSKPAFKKDGTVTAGNSSGLNDGAAALVVAGARAGAAPGTGADRRRIVSLRVGGGGPEGDGASAPCPPCARRSRRPAWRADAHRPVRAQRGLRRPEPGRPARAEAGRREGQRPRRAPSPSGIPIGASGARILVTLIHALRARGPPLRRGGPLHRRRPGRGHGRRTRLGGPVKKRTPSHKNGPILALMKVEGCPVPSGRPRADPAGPPLTTPKWTTTTPNR